MKLKILIGVLVFLIVVNLATIGSYIYFRVYQDHWKQRPIEFSSDFPGRFRTPPRLGLDPGQRHQLLELRRSFAEDTREFSEEIRKQREEIFQMLKEDSISMTMVEVKLQKIAALRVQIEKVAIKKLMEARSYLSVPQREHLYRFLLMEPPQFKEAPPFGDKPGFIRDRDQKRNFNHKKKE